MAPRYVEQTPTTPPFQFLSGAFKLSNWKIPYFSTTMHLEDVANSLHLAAELPGAETIDWKIQELYQRDIDWPRVERDILPYLNNREQPQFFNSITIALLPFDEHKNELLPNFDVDFAWSPPGLPDAAQRFNKTLQVGPISLGFWDAWTTPADPGFQSGELCWNKDQLYGVAIDGQHRLAAIKSLVNNISSSTREFRETRVPVVLLIFAPTLGFNSPSLKEHIELLRVIFIDLNKHSKPVSRARQILLDDRDPHAVCIRELVTDHLSDNYDELAAEPPQLPLAVVDWHSEQAKFDAGPYVTTILGLDWIVSHILESRPISDYTEYSKIKTQIEKLNRTLNVNLTDAIERVDELAKFEISSFSYTDAELKTIADAFAQIWSKPICKILTTLKPYSDLLERRARNNSLSLHFQHWYEMREKADGDKYYGHALKEYQALITRYESRVEDPISEISLKNQLKELESLKTDNLAYNVVFQRAVVEAFIEYAKIDFKHIEELWFLENEDEELDVDFDTVDYLDSSDYSTRGLPGPGDRGDAQGSSVENTLSAKVSNRADQFLDALNGMILSWPDVLRIDASFSFIVDSDTENETYFWLGTLLKPEGGIDFTQAASRRAKDLLFVAATMYLYDEETDPGPGSNFQYFWDRCFSDDAPAVCRRVRRAIERFTTDKRGGSAASRILRSRELPYSAEDALFEARIRFEKMWSVLDL